MIGVVVPVHNEEASLGRCLESLLAAARRVGEAWLPCEVIVVLDACRDASAEIASDYPVQVVETDLQCVGAARALGASRAIDRGARWLSFTDADTVVALDWIIEQLSLEADAVCGTVAVDWLADQAAMRTAFEQYYRDVDGHRHIHGANLGVSVAAYLEAGGFGAHRYDEDVSLVHALLALGKNIAWSARPRVITSSRLRGRMEKGFAATLQRLQLHGAQGISRAA